MCGQCVFLKEKYYKEGNGGGKKYYCEYLNEYICCNCKGCAKFQKDAKRSSDTINNIINDMQPMMMEFLLKFILEYYFSL